MLKYLSKGVRYNPGEGGARKLPRNAATRGDGISKAVVTMAKPFPPVARVRHVWEFYIVSRGVARPVAKGRTGSAPFRGKSMWVLAPTSDHAWETRCGSTCEVTVFHFTSVPVQLRAVIEASGGEFRGFDLPAKGLKEVDATYREVLDHYTKPRFTSPIHFELAACRLALLALHGWGEASKLAAFDPIDQRVAFALEWYRQHLSEGVNVHDIAQAMGVTPGHLRYLFKTARGVSVRAACADVQMQTAKELLLEPSLSSKEVAVRCGFGAFSQFYRAFKRYHGISPGEWSGSKEYMRDKTALNFRKRLKKQ